MPQQLVINHAHVDWVGAYRRVRACTEKICAPLAVDDYQLQSIVETSPPKWHLAHVSWFYETFILSEFYPGYRPFHPRFNYLFNSYYETVGRMHPRPQRGLLSRPTVDEIYNYRAYVDQHMEALLNNLEPARRSEVLKRLELGLNHEQQHQELLFMDIKHNLFMNPLYPAYREDIAIPDSGFSKMDWVDVSGGIQRIGSDASDFAFDNETPRHQVLLNDCRLAERLVSNGEFLEFIADSGYRNPALWLADGWHQIQRAGWQHPLYWLQQDDDWFEFTLSGLRKLDLYAPVCHISYYEADAYARWVGKRLPLEAELEVVLAQQKVTGNLADGDVLQPMAASTGVQWFGDCWNWTASAYAAYPKFRPLTGSMGEYNGKFMSNQMVLKGGCCFTPAGHTRATYRNFFYPHDRWVCGGIRLAEDV